MRNSCIICSIPKNKKKKMLKRSHTGRDKAKYIKIQKINMLNIGSCTKTKPPLSYGIYNT